MRYWRYLAFNLFAAGIFFPAAAMDVVDTTASQQELSAYMNGGDYVRLGVRYLGVYKVTGVQLREAGLDLGKVQPKNMSLTNEGQPVPVNVVHKQPGKFTDSDYIEFVGNPPIDDTFYYKARNLENLYLLRWNGGHSPLRYQNTALTAAGKSGTTIRATRHFERDEQAPRFVPELGQQTDGFYWFYASADTPRGHESPVPLELESIDRASSDSAQLTINVVGLTNVSNLKPHHQFDILLKNDHETTLGQLQFDGISRHSCTVTVPVSELSDRPNSIVLRSPANRRDAIDSITIDSYDIEYHRKLQLGELSMADLSGRSADAQVAVFHADVVSSDTRVFCPQTASIYTASPSQSVRISLPASDRQTSFIAVTSGGLYPVNMITVQKPAETEVAAKTDKADVLVYYHPRLADAAQFYRRYRESQGLKVLSVNVEGVYDALSNGFISDVAIKRHARHVAEGSDRLRYVVLLGDSVADYREARNYDDIPFPQGLIPIHWVRSPSTHWTGGYLDDNYYASFSSTYTPDLAVGRIPAASNEQAFSYLKKVVEYEVLQKSKNDPALVVSSVEKSFQDLVGEIQKSHADQFTTITALFPETTEAAREVSRLRQAFDSGVQLLYYVGHGGGFVWRVGPVDFQRQKDLFTPQEVHKLKNAEHYPVITCSSCYTTSFDLKESLGESLVFQPSGGAIAVIGTPWKSTVYEDHAFNKLFIDAYTTGSITRLGDAFLKAKQLSGVKGSQPSSQAFILLGDPCLALQRRQ